MDSADIDTRLQLSDTSSIPPMHGGFLLILLVYTGLPSRSEHHMNICQATLKITPVAPFTTKV